MEKEKEVWVTAQFINNDGSVEVFPGYQVSNLGRVMSLNYGNSKKPKILKPGHIKKSHGTYHNVNLYKDKKSYVRNIHRLVLSSFEPKGYFKKAVVDHIDSNPSNNRLSNLRWVTQQENSSTPHFREAQSKALTGVLTNRSDLSKRVKVTYLYDGYFEIFPSTREACRSLGLPSRTAAYCIFKHNGFYKKLNLLFEYV